MKLLKTYIIRVFNNSESKLGAERCLKSIEDTGSYLEPTIYPATVPEYLSHHWDLYLDSIPWKYPLEGSRHDLLTGLLLRAYIFYVVIFLEYCARKMKVKKILLFRSLALVKAP